MNIQIDTAKGAMTMLLNQARSGYLDNIGVTVEDFEKLVDSQPWLPNDRNRVTRTFNSIMFQTMDILGVPRFQMPAEYIGAGIAFYVGSINTHVACRFFEKGATAESLSRGVDDCEMCTAKQLFAIVVQLVADPRHSYARHEFVRRTGLALEKVNMEEIEKERSQQDAYKVKRKSVK